MGDFYFSPATHTLAAHSFAERVPTVPLVQFMNAAHGYVIPVLAQSAPNSAAVAAATILTGISFLFGGLIFAAFYFFPTIIAFRRDRPNKLPIFIVNFFFGWSVIGWVVSLVWALSTTEQRPQQIVIHQTIQGPAPTTTIAAPPTPTE